MANNADPDQLASSEASWSGSALFANTGYILVQQDKSKINGILINLGIIYYLTSSSKWLLYLRLKRVWSFFVQVETFYSPGLELF